MSCLRLFRMVLENTAGSHLRIGLAALGRAVITATLLDGRPVEVGDPIVHEQPPPLEQARAGVAGPDLILDDVGPRCLHQVARMVRLLGR